LVLRGVGQFVSWILILPILLSWRLNVLNYVTSGRILSLIPGRVGVHLRRAWYRATLASCGQRLTVDFLAVIKETGATIGDDVFIGDSCWIAEVTIGNNTMIGGHSSLLGGPHTHRFDRTDIPMGLQGSDIHRIHIGSDVWIGRNCSVMADIASGTVVGAGSVVTRIFGAGSVLAGSPARPISSRAGYKVMSHADGA
jgi:acetyltransferase-like isoleucine patch superfamily enzyme